MAWPHLPYVFHVRMWYCSSCAGRCASVSTYASTSSMLAAARDDDLPDWRIALLHYSCCHPCTHGHIACPIASIGKTRLIRLATQPCQSTMLRASLMSIVWNTFAETATMLRRSVPVDAQQLVEWPPLQARSPMSCATSRAYRMRKVPGDHSCTVRGGVVSNVFNRRW
jgi:hypothetical protein